MAAHELHIIISITCAQAAEGGAESDTSVAELCLSATLSVSGVTIGWEENDTSSSPSRRPGIGFGESAGSFFPTKQKYKIYTNHLRYYNSNNR